MKRLLACLLPLALAGAAFVAPRPRLAIIFIGDSITHGSRLDSPATQAPPVWAVAYLRKEGWAADFSNQGVSGHTTVDFLPGTGTDFPHVVAAADALDAKAAVTLVFSIMLGTNDSAEQGPNGSPVSPGAYRANLKTIIDSLLARYPKAIVVLNRPIWYSPTTYNGARYLQPGLDRLQTYFPEIDTLVKEYAGTGRVRAGDKDAFAYFREHYRTDLGEEQGRVGAFYLHPNAKGAEALGDYWGKAIKKMVH
jgi:lysophospholipase L1-like esterase